MSRVLVVVVNIAAMYGAVKKLIQIVENQQKEIENLKSRLTTKEIKGV